MDAVLMFKPLAAGALCNLSDDQIEYQVRDRLSSVRFLEAGRRRSGSGRQDGVAPSRDTGADGNGTHPMLTREAIMRRFQVTPPGFRNMRFDVGRYACSDRYPSETGALSGLQPKGNQCRRLFFSGAPLKP
ncbi:MAG: hypothetical protein ACJAZ1_002788 [Yoonia sp.]|jgi:hypothetical protein